MGITLQGADDLRKLEGYMVERVSWEPTGLKIVLSHVASNNKLVVQLTPQVQLGLNNGNISVLPSLNINVTEQPKELV